MWADCRLISQQLQGCSFQRAATLETLSWGVTPKICGAQSLPGVHLVPTGYDSGSGSGSAGHMELLFVLCANTACTHAAGLLRSKENSQGLCACSCHTQASLRTPRIVMYISAGQHQAASRAQLEAPQDLSLTQLCPTRRRRHVMAAGAPARPRCRLPSAGA